MNRFISHLSLLIIGLSVLLSAIDLGLTQIASSPRQSQLALYTPEGERDQLYTGSMPTLMAESPAANSTLPHLMRRAKARIYIVSEEQGSWL